MRTTLKLLAAAVMLLGASTASAQRYEYDGAGRLTSVRHDDGSTERYTYDANGNITRMHSAVASAEAETGEVFALRLEARPNPSAGRASLHYRLERGAEVEIVIATTNGEVVMRRSMGSQSVGEHVLQWSATTAAGERLADGVYVATVEARMGATGTVRRGMTKLVVGTGR